MLESVESTAPGSLLGKVEGAAKLFVKGRRSREADLEGAVTFFLELIRPAAPAEEAVRIIEVR